MRTQQDTALKPEIARVVAGNFAIYGVRKVWQQMMRERFVIARCTVERLMYEMGVTGVIGRKPVPITIGDRAASGPRDQDRWVPYSERIIRPGAVRSEICCMANAELIVPRRYGDK